MFKAIIDADNRYKRRLISSHLTLKTHKTQTAELIIPLTRIPIRLRRRHVAGQRSHTGRHTEGRVPGLLQAAHGSSDPIDRNR